VKVSRTPQMPQAGGANSEWSNWSYE